MWFRENLDRRLPVGTFHPDPGRCCSLAEARHIRSGGLLTLVILDEVGRGTATRDGLVTLEHLHGTVGCRTPFATLYHALADAAEVMTNARCMAMDASAGRHSDVSTTG